ncbi:ribose-5-phosphate isomerase RpiA [Lichenihabitans sp. Uapishka_5]|uniref:ribose-5-phosphate isomerase RpiA n=1 Tax=Lichenihabitans sp. Uapishka_5 TaxID=3037302 RepID=UPI0029E7D8DF|nr:ribose-5-phosphate isomerase RpiA [Lichenihabitans sp. Uapishka_5]MDX7950736.1 ribose-5-phosphate isomerase RpiA [Lichenihabitans sp. Uapishka_5]
MPEANQNDLKALAAARALDFVQDGMRLGLGTGSTATLFVAQLATKVSQGLKITCVATSEATEAQARAAGIPMTTLDAMPELDLVVDGADEFDPALRLIKGGGGALLREKIVAAAAHRMVVVADASKQVETLGRFPLPVEVNPFGLGATRRLVAEVCRSLGLPDEARLRPAKTGSGPFITDGGHLILDLPLGAIPAPEALAAALLAVPGVVEHGLFIGLATAVVLATAGGTRVIDPSVKNGT